MKVLDVNNLQAGIDFTVKDIEKFTDQIGGVQKAVYNFHSLEDALKGQGGEAIRAFYQYCHEPFLIFLHQSFIDYKNVLIEMKDAVDSFESNEKGFVSQEFLENDVKGGLDKVKKKAVELTDDANSIIESVQELVSIDKIDESDLAEDVRRGKDKADDLVEKLHALDDEGVRAFETVKENLQFMRSYLSEIEAKFQNGDLTIEDFSISAISDIEAFGAITENIFGEGGVFGLILNKLKNGEAITAVERESLYHFYQTKILNDEKKKGIEEIASFINEKDIDKLKERLNEVVIVSKDDLEEEMTMIQAYIYLGDKSPNELDIERDNKQKLEAYLNILQSYYIALNKWDNPVAQIHELNYKENPEGLSGHYLQTVILTDEYRSNMREKMSKEEFRDFTFNSDTYYDPDVSIAINLDNTEVTYYSKADASNLENFLQTEGLIKKKANYTFDFILNYSIGKVIGLLGKQASSSKVVYDYLAGKEQLEEQITVEQAKDTASLLGMEFSILNNETTKGSSYGTEVKLYPTETTFQALERWKEVYKDDPNIPYPEKYIELQDWYKIAEFLYQHNAEIDDDIYDYIKYETE